MESRGVVYVATGKKFVDEALISIASVKTHMPDIPVTLFTDLEEYITSRPDGVESVRLLPEVTRSCRDKINPLSNSPYEKTLFLDTDTYLCEPVYDIFEMLNRFDIALAQAPDRYQYHLSEVPDCFTELNSGVIAFRKSSQVMDLFNQWENTFLRLLELDSDSHRDQHSLRYSLFHSKVQFFVLPPEYNFRTICPGFAGKHCSVKIIHGRHARIDRVASRLNHAKEARVFLTTPYRYVTGDISTYDTFVEATMNGIFQSLPGGIKSWLSNLRARLS